MGPRISFTEFNWFTRSFKQHNTDANSQRHFRARIRNVRTLFERKSTQFGFVPWRNVTSIQQRNEIPIKQKFIDQMCKLTIGLKWLIWVSKKSKLMWLIMSIKSIYLFIQCTQTDNQIEYGPKFNFFKIWYMIYDT